MEKVLVTGGSGYVGREVIEQLLKSGKQVTALVHHTPPDQDIPLIKADMTNEGEINKALAGKTFDWILHNASLPGDTGDPQEMVRVNVNGTLNLLEFARKTGVQRFVQISSISAYEWYPATKFSPPDYMPVDENHPTRPRDMYSTSKRIQELLVMTYYYQYQVPTTVLRLTAVVGPYGRGGGRGYREMAEQLAEGKSVQIPHFSAEELCHYVDVRDVARMEIAVAEHPNAVGEIFNCVGPAPVRGSDFVDYIQRLIPAIKAEFGFPWSMAQGGEISFSMEKARRLLDFEPKYTLEDSVKSIVEWVKQGGLDKTRTASDSSYGSGVQKD